MLSNSKMVMGMVEGTAAAINVELGFIPDFVILTNVTDGNHLVNWWNMRVCAFSSGGTTGIAAGDIIQGATSTGVRAKVGQVVIQSGSFAAGNAAGYLLWHALDENGTFGSENVDVLVGAATIEKGGAVSVANQAAVAAQTELANVDAGTPATVTGTGALSPYKGSTTASQGFTIGSALSESTDLLAFVAFRGDRPWRAAS